MQGTIGIEQLIISCIIGALPEERESEQFIFIDIQVGLDFENPSKSDDIKDTVNYMTLAEICKQLAEKNKYRLLETLACDIVNQFLKEPSIQWAWVRIKKPVSVLYSNGSYVEYRRDKSGAKK